VDPRLRYEEGALFDVDGDGESRDDDADDELLLDVDDDELLLDELLLEEVSLDELLLLLLLLLLFVDAASSNDGPLLELEASARRASPMGPRFARSCRPEEEGIPSFSLESFSSSAGRLFVFPSFPCRRGVCPFRFCGTGRGGSFGARNAFLVILLVVLEAAATPTLFCLRTPFLLSVVMIVMVAAPVSLSHLVREVQVGS
jgi:hypothetical protein